jgi:hypothetical protein
LPRVRGLMIDTAAPCWCDEGFAGLIPSDEVRR